METLKRCTPGKAVFLDRDGVLNVERGDYTWKTEDFEVCEGVPEALALLRENGYKLIVITNQAGIAKGLYTKADVLACHQKLQETCGNLLDGIYMAPSYPAVSESLGRKPGSLMLERALAKYNLDPIQCWLIGDRQRDLQAADKVGIPSILVGEEHTPHAHILQARDLRQATQIILEKQGKHF